MPASRRSYTSVSMSRTHMIRASPPSPGSSWAGRPRGPCRSAGRGRGPARCPPGPRGSGGRSPGLQGGADQVERRAVPRRPPCQAGATGDVVHVGLVVDRHLAGVADELGTRPTPPGRPGTCAGPAPPRTGAATRARRRRRPRWPARALRSLATHRGGDHLERRAGRGRPRRRVRPGHGSARRRRALRGPLLPVDLGVGVAAGSRAPGRPGARDAPAASRRAASRASVGGDGAATSPARARSTLGTAGRVARGSGRHRRRPPAPGRPPPGSGRPG